MKKFLLLFSAVIIIVFSFITPKILFKVEDLSREKEVFARVKKESKIDVQAENIYLVKTIHELYMEKEVYDTKTGATTVVSRVPTIEHTEDPELTTKVKEEIQKMIDIGILKNINFDEYSSNSVQTIFFADCKVITDNLSKEDSHGIGVTIEQKTGKIISLDFNKQIFRMDVAQKKQLEDYVKYLDLDIIGDWKYENETLVSEKAQLTAMIDYGEYGCVLNIAPTEVYNEYYEMVTAPEKKK